MGCEGVMQRVVESVSTQTLADALNLCPLLMRGLPAPAVPEVPSPSAQWSHACPGLARRNPPGPVLNSSLSASPDQTQPRLVIDQPPSLVMANHITSLPKFLPCTTAMVAQPTAADDHGR
jgi:hypothetical protein